MYGWWPVPISPRPHVQSRRSAIAQNRGRQRHSIISFHKVSLVRMTNCKNESHHPTPYRIGTYLWYNWTVGTFQLATQNGVLGRHVGASRAPSCSASLQVRFFATLHPQSGHRHGSPAQRPVQKGIRRGHVRLAKRQIPTQAYDLQDFVSGVCGSHVDDASSAAKC
jgi:hypothetical protein